MTLGNAPVGVRAVAVDRTLEETVVNKFCLEGDFDIRYAIPGEFDIQHTATGEFDTAVDLTGSTDSEC